MNLFKKIFQPRVNYQPLIEVKIFKDAILHNLSTFQKAYPKLQFAPVLKSNAYGHGLIQVAKILDNQNLPFFMVDSFYEALVLRRAGKKTKILVLGFVREKQLLENYFKDVSFGIIDLEILKNLSAKSKKPINIHLKIDTGMHRQGILEEQIGEATQLIKQNVNINLEGICSHLADADGTSDAFTKEQIERWNKIVEKFQTEFPNIKYLHLTNTAGSFYSKDALVNVGRLGLGLFGINTSPFNNFALRPALQMESIISSVKSIGAGEKVGYGVTFTESDNMRVATVPVGYNEGVDRRLSNKGCYKVNDVFCPVAGRVSMNMSTIDVSRVPDVQLENEVVVFSSNPADKNSIENVARACETIPYEILVHIPQYLRRTVV